MTTLKEIGNLKGNSNAITRWAKLGPYYAMFPIDFAFETVEKYSKPGEYILDPFAGRFSSIYAGATLGRNVVGIEINPLGWIYGETKINPAPMKQVIERLKEIYNSRQMYYSQADGMSEFFSICYCREVLSFLLAARDKLDWKNKKIDRTLAAFILVSAHGKLGEGLSNQMRQTKSMGQNYSINWWKDNGFEIPPEINPYEFMREKIERRYAKGIPETKIEKRLIYGDATQALKTIKSDFTKKGKKISLVFTSPPYWSMVDYHVDQWIRLWILGGNPEPKTSQEKYKGRFVGKEKYKNLLEEVFGGCADIMAKKSVIYVRTDVREFTLNTTKEILRKHFPNHTMTIIDKPFLNRTQTELYNANISKIKNRGEVDIILQS